MRRSRHRKAWLNTFGCVKPGRVLYVDQEYGPSEFCRRVARLSRGLGCDPRAVLSQILYVNDPMLVLCGELCRTKEGRAKPRPKALVHLIAKLQAVDDVALCLLDPLRNLLDGSENDADTAFSAGIALEAFRRNTKAPVVVAHHLNKRGSYSVSRGLMGRFDLLLEATDEEQPWYSARGRTLRRGDAVARRFTIETRHENDDNDLIAATHLSARFEGMGSNEGLSKPARKLLTELRQSEGMSH